MSEPALTNAESIAEFRRTLSAAKNGGQPWFVIATLLSDALRGTRERDHAELRAEAAAATRLSPGVLRRYVLLLDRLRNIAELQGLERAAFLSPVFNAAEVGVRIYDRNAEEGLAALRELKAGDVTLVQLRDRLSKVPVELEGPAEADEKLGREMQMERNERMGRTVIRERHLKVSFMLQALEADRPALWPDSAKIRRRPRSPFFTGHQGFEVVGADPQGAVIAGVEMFVLDRDRPDYLDDVFASYLTLATFYDRFYFAFSPGTPAGYISHASDLLRKFGAASIGILVVSDAGAVAEMIKPHAGPVPNRVDDYALMTGGKRATDEGR